MTSALVDLQANPVRSLVPALEVMGLLGYSQQACLKGTGIMTSQLDDSRALMTLQQELTFYRNAMGLCDDPAIGLKLGKRYLPQRYGLFGYALLSAATFRHALSLTENFGRLTFSFFSFGFGVEGARAWFSLQHPPPLEQDILDVYLDRDMSAAQVAFSEILGFPLPLLTVHLPHDGKGCQQAYREHFGCEVEFDSGQARLVFSSSFLDDPLPQSDPDTSQHFQRQCQMLIATLANKGSFVDDVRMLMLARPGFFPDIDYIAEKLGTSARTLRRRLGEEGASYRDMLDEVRFGLAREYLGSTQLSMDEISGLLGYSESGNFSHAFRRWSGLSPSAWRQSPAARGGV